MPSIHSEPMGVTELAAKSTGGQERVKERVGLRSHARPGGEQPHGDGGGDDVHNHEAGDGGDGRAGAVRGEHQDVWHEGEQEQDERQPAKGLDGVFREAGQDGKDDRRAQNANEGEEYNALPLLQRNEERRDGKNGLHRNAHDAIRQQRKHEGRSAGHPHPADCDPVRPWRAHVRILLVRAGKAWEYRTCKPIEVACESSRA